MPDSATPVVPGNTDQDPSALTTQQLNTRITALRELVEAQIGAVKERLTGNDKAVDLLQKKSDASPSIAQVNDMVVALRELHSEKFESIQTQFKERDTRTDQTSRDSKTAIDAALQAAKEAVGKTELSFTKQFDQIGVQVATLSKNFDDKINDMKDRLTDLTARRLEAASVTQTHSQAGRDNTGFIAMIISGIAAAIGIAAFVAARLT